MLLYLNSIAAEILAFNFCYLGLYSPYWGSTLRFRRDKLTSGYSQRPGRDGRNQHLLAEAGTLMHSVRVWVQVGQVQTAHLKSRFTLRRRENSA